MGSTVFGIIAVDRLGRRALLIGSGVAMVCCEIVIGVCLGYFFNRDHGKLTDSVSNGVLAVMCIYVANYAWSWGKLPLKLFGMMLV